VVLWLRYPKWHLLRGSLSHGKDLLSIPGNPWSIIAESLCQPVIDIFDTCIVFESFFISELCSSILCCPLRGGVSQLTVLFDVPIRCIIIISAPSIGLRFGHGDRYGPFAIGLRGIDHQLVAERTLPLAVCMGKPDITGICHLNLYFHHIQSAGDDSETVLGLSSLSVHRKLLILSWPRKCPTLWPL